VISRDRCRASAVTFRQSGFSQFNVVNSNICRFCLDYETVYQSRIAFIEQYDNEIVGNRAAAHAREVRRAGAC